jgi:hypothetical protein
MQSCLSIALILVGAVAMLTSATNAGDKHEKIPVRAVPFPPKDPKDPRLSLRIGGQNKLTVLTDAAAAEKLLGKENAKRVLSMVDFEKEQLVFVSWITDSTTDGSLKHEIKGAGAERLLTFYVQGSGKVIAKKGQSSVELVVHIIGAVFFALPRNVKVAFDPKER